MLLSWRRSNLFGVLGALLYSGHFAMAIELNITSTGMLQLSGRLDWNFVLQALSKQ